MTAVCRIRILPNRLVFLKTLCRLPLSALRFDPQLAAIPCTLLHAVFVASSDIHFGEVLLIRNMTLCSCRLRYAPGLLQTNALIGILPLSLLYLLLYRTPTRLYFTHVLFHLVLELVFHIFSIKWKRRAVYRLRL
jgi:hypothetical protein